jgi:hypothetical protein
VWQLGFDVQAEDRMLRFYTEWPQDAYLALTPGVQGGVKVLRAVAQPARADDGAPGAGAAMLWLDLACRPLPPLSVADEAVLPWRVALASKKSTGSIFLRRTGGEKLSIIDLDAAGDVPGLQFAPSPLAATANGTAYLSASPVPMQLAAAALAAAGSGDGRKGLNQAIAQCQR